MNESNQNPLIDTSEDAFNALNSQEQKASIEEIGKVETAETSAKENTRLTTNLTLKIHKSTELSQDCYIGADIAPADLLNDIIKVNMNDVLAPLLVERTSFFRKLSVDKIMQWQKGELSEPLLKMPDKERPVALQMFRNLLSYMMDRKSSKKPIQHARKFLKLTLHAEQIIKDEAYIQVLKQIRENKKYDSLLRGWKFMAILASVFVPSNDIYNLILNFLFFELQNNDDNSIINHAKYIFVRMLKTKASGRKNVPCLEEMEYIEYLKPIPIPIYFFSGTQTNVKIESYTTIRDLKTMMMNILDFNPQKAIYYSVYEVCSKKSVTEERFLDDDEKVCDVISLWKTDMDKASKNRELVEFKLYLKLLVYYPFEEDDNDTVSVVYYQTLYDVLSGKFGLSQEQITILAALQLLNEFGSERESAFSSVQGHIEKYIPAAGMEMLSKDQWTENIMELYSSLSSYSKTQAKWNYLEELKQIPTYQAQQFDATFNITKSGSNDDNIPDNCVIGIKPEGIMILDKDRNEIVFYKYEVVMNWGISKDQFILCISKEDNDIRKVCFITSQTKVIQTLVEIYCNILAGKTIKEIMEIVKGYSTKFDKLDTGRKRHSSKYKKATSYVKPVPSSRSESMSQSSQLDAEPVEEEISTSRRINPNQDTIEIKL